MKLRKTRIKKETKANGAVVYTAQYKGWIDWYNFNAWDGSSLMWSIYASYTKGLKKELDGSQERAQGMIDYYISYVNHKNASAIENEIVKTEYEKYP